MNKDFITIQYEFPQISVFDIYADDAFCNDGNGLDMPSTTPDPCLDDPFAEGCEGWF
jgi:hypothetical protein